MDRIKTISYSVTPRSRIEKKKRWVGICLNAASGIIIAALVATIYIVSTATLQDEYGKITADESKAAVKAELSVREQVWKILTEEGKLSFDEAMKGMYIVECESGFDVNAYNRTTDDFGVWQINYDHQIKAGKTTIACAMDYVCATEYAIKLYRESKNSWKLWVCNK